ncbi:oligopeptide/dipeptide ABC transporter ATP-binding protein [Aquipuribacter nitratireducens]|uniref:ABC transporter ATP-binding protein n=1 Tax=Aquipuribacter nitratireducens TaxID=650104 RepID=A0ABW0GM56_9MICO
MSAQPADAPRTSEHSLEIRDLHVTFPTSRGPATVVRGVDLHVSPRETLAVVGESGSGKSVSMLAVLGLLPSSATVTGSALYRGREVLGASDEELRRLRGPGLGMVFQDPMTSLNPVLTIRRQLLEGLVAHTDRRERRRQKQQLLQRARDLLDEVGIPDPDRALRSYPHQLSGGQRQRVMIAIALAHDPAVLVADEATTALDVTVQAQILRLVAALQEEHGTAVVWITHDLGVVAGIADRVAVMYAGQVVESGVTDAVFDAPTHPYTRGLLASLPDIDADGTGHDRAPLEAMRGLPPDPVDPPPGCAFAPRCPIADPACVEHPQRLREVGPHHEAATRCPVPEEVRRDRGD